MTTSVIVAHQNNSFLPSEIARLVLGYLNDLGCKQSYQIFLNECPDLYEYRIMVSRGQLYPTSVNNRSLLDILALYCVLTKCNYEKRQKRNRIQQQQPLPAPVISNDPSSTLFHYPSATTSSKIVPILPKPKLIADTAFVSNVVSSPEVVVLEGNQDCHSNASSCVSTSNISVADNSPMDVQQNLINLQRKSRKIKVPRRFALPESIIAIPKNASSISDALVIDKVLERLFTSPQKIAESINSMDSSVDILQNILGSHSCSSAISNTAANSAQITECTDIPIDNHEYNCPDLHMSLSDLLFADDDNRHSELPALSMSTVVTALPSSPVAAGTETSSQIATTTVSDCGLTITEVTPTVTTTVSNSKDAEDGVVVSSQYIMSTPVKKNQTQPVNKWTCDLDATPPSQSTVPVTTSSRCDLTQVLSQCMDANTSTMSISSNCSTNSKRYRYICSHCNMFFISRRRLETHMKSHDKVNTQLKIATKKTKVTKKDNKQKLVNMNINEFIKSLHD